MSDKKIMGSCFCGAVQLEVKGEPTAMLYCHCKDCQAWSAGPINSASYKGARIYWNLQQDRG